MFCYLKGVSNNTGKLNYNAISTENADKVQ